MTVEAEVLTMISAVLVAVITSAAGVVVAGVQLFGKLREIAADAATAREHVANDHGTNLREDIDDIARQVGALRIEAADEHAELWKAVTGRRCPTGRIPIMTTPEEAPND